MGICLQSVVAAAAVRKRARKNRGTGAQLSDFSLTTSSSRSLKSVKRLQNHQPTGPTFFPNYRLFRHRWRRASQLSALAPNLSADRTANKSRHVHRPVTSCGRNSSSSHRARPSLTPLTNQLLLPSSYRASPAIEKSSTLPKSAMFVTEGTDIPNYEMGYPINLKHSTEEEKLRRRLRFFFLNPVEKWAASRRFPFKLFAQIVKIILVTLQLFLFASFRDSHITFVRRTEVAFSHMFLQGWDVSREVTQYPPSAGPLAVYSKDEFNDYVDFAIKNFADLESRSVGAFFRMRNKMGAWMTYCQTEYSSTAFDPILNTYKFDSHTKQECLEIPIEGDMGSFKIQDFLTLHNLTISGMSLVEATLLFAIKSIYVRPNGPLASPDCYTFDTELILSNQGQSGQLLARLETDAQHISCQGQSSPPPSDKAPRTLRRAVNVLVILICLISFILCARAVLKAQLLKWETDEFFKRRFNRGLTKQDRLEFLNLWYVLIIANDVLLVTGSIIKELMEGQHVKDDMWDMCSVLLGTGNLFVWFGVLRYLGFFRTYNMLIITLKNAFPSVMRFLFCALLIYAGFTLCGWLIFSPHHLKFQSLSSTSECLFSLVNGDDMFATFAGVSERSPLVWWFSRVYLYSFISLFIYVVLSLFIALIMDTYETIKMYYTEGFPKSDLCHFISSDDCVETLPIYEPQPWLPHLWSMFRRRRSGYSVIDGNQTDYVSYEQPA